MHSRINLDVNGNFLSAADAAAARVAAPRVVDTVGVSSYPTTTSFISGGCFTENQNGTRLPQHDEVQHLSSHNRHTQSLCSSLDSRLRNWNCTVSVRVAFTTAHTCAGAMRSATIATLC